LLMMRQTEIVPRLAGARFDAPAVRYNDGVLWARWRLADAAELQLLANLRGAPAPRPATVAAGRVIWGGTPAQMLTPWSVFWSIGAP
jgi:Domain of unknown function (DUF3459)